MSLVFAAVAALLATLLLSGVWIGLSLMGVGLGGLLIFRDMPVLKLLGQVAFGAATTSELVALPLFILMAELLFRTRIAEQMFGALEPLAMRLPGRLLHINVLSCTLFAAVSGSSAATAATVGRITVPELARRGYSPALTMGSLAGAGTLGFLIPPSIVMIIYGVLAEVSIIQLFFAGVLPGFALALGFMAWIALRTRISPGLVPPAEPPLGFADTLRALGGIAPVLLLVAAVIGSMYAGIATPNEAAAIGVLGALVLAALQRCLTLDGVLAALHSTIRTTTMICLILVCAAFLSAAVGFLGIARAAVVWVSDLGLGPWELMLALLVLYILLGCVLDGASMIVMTLPVTLPLVVAAGFDPVWFGVFLVMAVELAQVTPPVGINLFVIQGLTGASLGVVARAAFPFFLVMVAFTLLLVAWPDLALMLPRALQ